MTLKDLLDDLRGIGDELKTARDYDAKSAFLVRYDSGSTSFSCRWWEVGELLAKAHRGGAFIGPAFDSLRALLDAPALKSQTREIVELTTGWLKAKGFPVDGADSNSDPCERLALALADPARTKTH